ncbi:MAG: histidinol-phosphate transaminase [Deltaproteobacteria bacterium]|jgi:histidinol-phosphate aminotransferase|nr:histidinol-phosphate transaminase [Deltaproteobacteria bacterium]
MLQKPDQVREAVAGFEPYSPGLSIDEIRQRFGLDNVCKLASNENPLGVSPLVREAIERNAGLAFRYPQSGNPRLVKALAEHHNVPENTIVLGNGSDEVIDLLIRCRAEPGQHNIVVNRPCFSLYPLQARLCGVELREHPLQADFCFDWKGLRALVDENTSLVFITTPDNPSGYCPLAVEVEAFARSLPGGCLLVIDEAYMDFCATPDESSCATGHADGQSYSLLPRLAEFGNIAVLRTFSKSFGLAGLRLGYGILPPRLADYLCRVRLPFSINCLAEAAGLAALCDTDFYQQTLTVVSEGRSYLFTALKDLGCRVHESHSNFLMLRLPEACRFDAGQMFAALLERGIIIRHLKSYGLPEYLRISVGDADENRMLIRAMGELLK